MSPCLHHHGFEKKAAAEFSGPSPPSIREGGRDFFLNSCQKNLLKICGTLIVVAGLLNGGELDAISGIDDGYVVCNLTPESPSSMVNGQMS